MDTFPNSAPRESAKNKVDNFVLQIFGFPFSELIENENKRNELYAHVELLISKSTNYSDNIEKFIIENSRLEMIKYYVKALEIAKEINEKYDYLFPVISILRAYTGNQNAMFVDSIEESINKLENVGFDVSKCRSEKIVDEFGISDLYSLDSAFSDPMFYKVP